MTQSDPVHIIDFRDESNYSRIEQAKWGEELNIKVRPEAPPRSSSLSAKARRSEDGSWFYVTVLTENGPETHTWTWEILSDALLVHRGRPG